MEQTNETARSARRSRGPPTEQRGRGGGPPTERRGGGGPPTERRGGGGGTHGGPPTARTHGRRQGATSMPDALGSPRHLVYRTARRGGGPPTDGEAGWGAHPRNGDEGWRQTHGGPPTARTNGDGSMWRKSGRFEFWLARLDHGTINAKSHENHRVLRNLRRLCCLHFSSP